jgi:hypothetical protein
MNRNLLQQALDALEYHTMQTRPINHTDKAIETLKQELAKPEQESEAYRYAKRLAEFIWAKHYKEESPDWTPLPDVLGVLTQIDNMTCGLELAKPEQEPKFCKDCGKGLLGKDHIHTCSPQVKREWVGLADDVVAMIEKTVVTRKQAIRMIEHHLKELNT